MVFARKEQVIKVIILVYVVFGASILYFLFFNAGLDIVTTAQTNNSTVRVVNNSVHAIRDITVAYVKGDVLTAIETIPILKPKEFREYPISSEWVSGGRVILQASAPFHLTKQSIINNIAGGVTNANITFQLSYSDTGFVGSPVEIDIIGNSQEDHPIPLKAELTFLNDSNLVSPRVKDWVIAPGNDNNVSFSFTPQTRDENLSIKIRVFSEWNTFLEREIVMGIIPNPVQGGNE